MRNVQNRQLHRTLLKPVHPSAKDGDSYPVLLAGDEKVSVSYNYGPGSSAVPLLQMENSNFCRAISQLRMLRSQLLPVSLLGIDQCKLKIFQLSITFFDTNTDCGSCDEQPR